MNDKNKRVKAGTKSRAAAKKPKLSAKAKASPRTPADDTAPAANGFDFVGKVESLRVKAGAAPDTFEFSLRGRHGQRQSFKLDPSDPVAINAMVQILVAAHGLGAKIGVNAGSSGEGIALVKELAWRPKLRKPA